MQANLTIIALTQGLLGPGRQAGWELEVAVVDPELAGDQAEVIGGGPEVGFKSLELIFRHSPR